MENTTNSGASNASDFQPPTQNPQQAPGQVFPEQNTVQQGSNTSLLDNSNATISVPVNPAPAPAQPAVAQAKSGNGLFLFLAVLIGVILLSFHLWRRRMIVLSRSAPVEPQPEMAEPREIKKPVKARTTNPATKAKRKATKKRKRSRK